MQVKEIQQALRLLAKEEQVAQVKRFFKTEVGGYAEKDLFLGVSVPEIRKIAKKYFFLSLDEIQVLLTSPFHEERFLALVILIHQYKNTNKKEQIFQFYLEHLPWINNWDLVDVSAPHIVGPHLKTPALLLKMAESSNLWERRIAIVACLHWIRNLDFSIPFQVFQVVLSDSHDLIQKALGWMLREIGKKNRESLTWYLKDKASLLSRTTLRYAIEHFSPKDKKFFTLKKHPKKEKV